MIVIGATGLPEALATLPPSSGTPTGLSAYGTIVVATTLTLSGSPTILSTTILSTVGPFYVEKLNVGSGPYAFAMNLAVVVYDGALYGALFPACPTVIGLRSLYGDVMSVVPFRMIDQTGAAAVPAASGVTFLLESPGCTEAAFTYGTGEALSFEATVLAPTSATVSICASETPSYTCSVP